MERTIVEIPAALKPADGRFGCGPSKVRPEALARLASQNDLMGTSHRQQPVRDLVARVRSGLGELFALPDGYEVALGNGGTTAFWDAAAAWLVRERSLHLTYGEFSSKFAKSTAGAPFLADPIVVEAEPGDAPAPVADPDADVLAWAHNETSTGVMVPVERPEDSGEALVLIDATSGAGGLPVDVGQADAYYFAPQKAFARGWRPLARAAQPGRDRADRAARRRRRWPLAAGLPLARGRARELAQGADLQHARAGDADPARRPDRVAARGRRARLRRLAEPSLVAASLRLGGGVGGRHSLRQRSLRSARWSWGRSTSTSRWTPRALAGVLRANGIVDTEPYRKLGRNQLRIGMFPAVDPADVEALTACIDWVLENADDVRR